jgi:hypothetical protein
MKLPFIDSNLLFRGAGLTVFSQLSIIEFIIINHSPKLVAIKMIV